MPPFVLHNLVLVTICGKRIMASVQHIKIAEALLILVLAYNVITTVSATAQPTIQGAGSSNNALDIVDEMVDRERRKNNIVVYNLQESTDQNTDIQSFKTLSNTVFKLDLDVVNTIRLGPKAPNKDRLLLLTVEDIEDKAHMLSTPTS